MPASLRLLAILGTGFCVAAFPSGAETTTQKNGTDTFMAATSGQPDLQTKGDLFASGGAVVTKGRVDGDAHVAGFDLDLVADVTGDLYAIGAALDLRAPVGGDVSMMGLSLRTARQADIAGNARLIGGAITLDGPIGGALAATGGDITLNAAIAGDALLQGESITFGPDARIAGTLTYSAPEPATIPPAVIPAARVVFHRAEPMMDRFGHMRDWGGNWGDDWGERWMGRDMPALPDTFGMATVFLVILGFLVLSGGALLALAPDRIEGLRLAATRKPALTLLSGVLGLAALVGLVPVAVMTVVGIPFVPIVMLSIMLIWTLGYAFGAYAVALGLYLAFGGREAVGLGLRIALLGGGVLAFGVLNFVPLLGWMANIGLALFGIGALSSTAFKTLAARLSQ